MRTKLQAARRSSQRGSAAVEAAIVLPILVLFITFPSLFWAMYFYKYSAAQKAVHDSALYLSTAPRLEMMATGPDGDPAAVTLAKKIIAKEMAGMNPPVPSIVCTYRQTSGAPVPKTCTTTNNQDPKQTLIQVSVAIDIRYLDPLTGDYSGMKISPYANISYVGN